MTTQHTTVFHCQECGRVVYQVRGMMTPVCCGESMVCAVADLACEVPETAANHRPSTNPADTNRRPAACKLK